MLSLSLTRFPFTLSSVPVWFSISFYFAHRTFFLSHPIQPASYSSFSHFFLTTSSPHFNWFWDKSFCLCVKRQLVVFETGVLILGNKSNWSDVHFHIRQLHNGAKSGSTRWIHLLARNGLGDQIHRLLSLYKLSALNTWMSVLSWYPNVKKLTDNSLSPSLYLPLFTHFTDFWCYVILRTALACK